jgi:hypothetical protein
MTAYYLGTKSCRSITTTGNKIHKKVEALDLNFPHGIKTIVLTVLQVKVGLNPEVSFQSRN